MATNVSRDSILDGIVSKVAALKPATGSTVTTAKYVRKVGRFMGKVNTDSSAFREGVAGVCPCILVGPDGPPRRVRTTIGRRVDRVESTFKVICFSDNSKSVDARASLLAMVEDVRRLVTARQLGLQIQPLMYAGESTEIDDERLMAIAVKFSTKHHVDYTVTPARMDTMGTAYGQVVFPNEDDGTPGALLGEVGVLFI